ncbi:MAG: sugar porter family MFS transporter [Thermodesulfobacteriota bacterium]
MEPLLPPPVPSDIVRRGYLLYLASAIAASGGMIFGYDLAVIGGAILFIRVEFALPVILVEIVIASALFGAMLGAAGGGKIADRWGRRPTLLFIAGLGILGPIASSLAMNVSWLILGRVLTGVCFGMASFVTPLYIAELAPAQSRGRLVTVYFLAVMVGILVAYLVDLAFAMMHQWRIMLAMGAVPGVILGIGSAVLPESPRWLMLQGCSDKACESLRRVRGGADIAGELETLLKCLNQKLGGWVHLLQPYLRIVLIIGIGLAIFRMVTGISIVIFYAPTIFEMSGGQSQSVDILATVGIAVAQVLATLLVMSLVDRWGRRTLLLIGLAGMVVSLVGLGLAVSPFFPSFQGTFAEVSLMVFAAFWVIGPGTIFFLLISEIYPANVRALAMSLATTVLWAAYFLDTLIFLSLLDVLGKSGTFWFNAFLGIIAWWFVYFLVPETRGISLDEIEDHWRNHRNPRDLGRPAR